MSVAEIEQGVFESTATIDNGSFGTRTIRFETGRLAQQAAGAVVAYLDDETMLLSATTASKNPKDHFDFFTLTAREDGDGIVEVRLERCACDASSSIAHVDLSSGANRYSAVGATFTGGRLALPGESFGDGSFFVHSSCVERGVDRAAFPEPGPHALIDGNLVLT